MKKVIKYLIAFLLITTTLTKANAQVSISVHIGPPALPVYEQPYCPGDGFMWVPGYWAYGDYGYFWVPGTWILAPQSGYYWTPGYWAFNGGYYGWHSGYWGQHVGYYGGINYGFGYGGRGYYGGEWSGNSFRYNTAVTRVNTTVVHNVYVNNTVVNNTTIVNNNRSSYNGQGGVNASPTRQEQAFAGERHVQPTQVQMAHEASERTNKNQFASVNHGHPGELAVAQPRIVKSLNANVNASASHTNTNAAPAANNTRQHADVSNVHQQGQVNNQREIRNQQINANMQRQHDQANQRVNTNQSTNANMRQPRAAQHEMRQPQMAPHQQEHVNGGNGKGREKER